MTKVRKKYRLLDSIETLRVYNLLRESQGIQIQPADGAESKLDAIVATASMILFGEEMYPDLSQKLAIYFYLIIKDHIFFDGNKRLAVLIVLVMLRMNKVVFSDEFANSLDALAISVENTESEHHKEVQQVLAEIFEENTMFIDEDQYST